MPTQVTPELSKKASQKIQQARLNLIIGNPFFATLVLKMPPAAVPKWIADGKGDGGTTDVYAAAAGGWAKTQKFGTIAPLYSVFYLIFVNQSVWDGLSPADRSIIEAAARKAEQSDFTLAEQADRKAIADHQRLVTGDHDALRG